MVISLFIYQALLFYNFFFEDIPIWFRVICYIGMFICMVAAQYQWSLLRSDVDWVMLRLKMKKKKKKKTKATL